MSQSIREFLRVDCFYLSILALKVHHVTAYFIINNEAWRCYNLPKKGLKIYHVARDTSLEFHGNQQLLLYQQMQI